MHPVRDVSHASFPWKMLQLSTPRLVRCCAAVVRVEVVTALPFSL